MTPTVVEAIRHSMLNAGRPSDATLVSLLAYGGLRPGEALALRWRHITDRSILVEQSVADGQLKPTKTGNPRRVVLFEALRDDLDQLRATQAPIDQDQLLFATGTEPWSAARWRNWRRRRFQPAAAAGGAPTARPYDLRHSFVSLLIHEGMSVVEVAAQAGHQPSLCLSTYAHLFAESATLDRGAQGAQRSIKLARKAAP